MKLTKFILIAIFSIVLGACSGSDTYRGDWKATNPEGEQLNISFGERDFSISSNGKTEKFEYSQNSINVTNSVETYGITLNDGRTFKIHFPIGNDESKGAILDANGNPLFIISRTDYLEYNDVFGL